MFAVARCTVDFVRPARLDDLLAVRTEVVGLGGARIEMVQLVERDGAAVARLGVTLAVLDARAMRPTRLPEALRRAFDAAASGEIRSRTQPEGNKALLLTAGRATTIRASAASGASIEHLPNSPIIRPSASIDESRPNRTRTGSHQMQDDAINAVGLASAAVGPSFLQLFLLADLVHQRRS